MRKLTCKFGMETVEERERHGNDRITVNETFETPISGQFKEELNKILSNLRLLLDLTLSNKYLELIIKRHKSKILNETDEDLF